MARRAKTKTATKRKSTSRKSSSSKYDSALNNLGGVIVVLLVVLGLFNLGAIGTLVAGLFRVIVGET